MIDPATGYLNPSMIVGPPQSTLDESPNIASLSEAKPQKDADKEPPKKKQKR